MMILACLQVTRNPTDQRHQFYPLHTIDQATYAMADMRGPLDTKFCPVDSTLGPWIRVGYENRVRYCRPIQYVHKHTVPKPQLTPSSVKKKGIATSQQQKRRTCW
jgi:hypothetical protein